MLSLGHPMLGDQLYSPPEVKAQAPRLLLHAQHLELTHPIKRHKIQVECQAEF
jgi:tRNA pseudouridine32 synthase/23S rRNA pseudouridine746 synthase